jgi:hypothetical protein
MKILILSPLFPPDTGAPADYVKELATRLGAEHQTELLVYGYLPESVSHVPCTAIDKRTSLLFRLFSLTRTLLKKSHKTDLILANNAPSIELPLLITSLLRKTPYILLLSDPIANAASMNGWYKTLHQLVAKRAKTIIKLDTEETYKKAEVLPFAEFDAAGEARRQSWWNNHVTSLLS